MNRILVTGGAGFPGSHLCDRLIVCGHDVLCVDNLFTGSKRNVTHLLQHPYFQLMRHYVTFPLVIGPIPMLRVHKKIFAISASRTSALLYLTRSSSICFSVAVNTSVPRHVFPDMMTPRTQ